MDFNLEQAIEILARTPLTLKAMLKDLPSEWAFGNEGDNTWAPFDVVGHLIHGERTDWVPRIEMILRAGESETFEPFDRFAQFDASKGKGLEELLDTFQDLRSKNVAALKGMGIGTDDLARAGMHPELGAVTLGELIATWVVHDLDHIAQIARTMGKQYAGAVGPWKAFLSVLK